jgi:hypothetical protein
MIGAFTYLRQVENEREMRIVEWTGEWAAPSRDSKLTVVPVYVGFHAYWEPGYCGCEDCRPIVGHGRTEEEAVEDYWSQWSASD